MKITKERSECFHPISITFETHTELNDFVYYIYESIDFYSKLRNKNGSPTIAAKIKCIYDSLQNIL